MTFVANESLQSGRIGPAILPDDAAPDLDYALERFKAASRAASHSKTPSKGKDNRQGCGYEDILTLLNSRNSALSDATRARLKPLLEVLSRQLSRPDGPIVAREPVVRLTPRPKSALPVETVLQIGTRIPAL
ncbi:MAG: hypothetical protein LBR29_07135, partial [Methylobacteriaceae bacterium]|nr:hypothetical protein [Methylobacteriaceae bacterium]